MFRAFGYQSVDVIHADGTSYKKHFSPEAHIQPDSGYVAVDTPIDEGDTVGIKDTRGGSERKLVTEVKIYAPKGASFQRMRHTQLKWGKARQARIARARRLTIENFHPRVVESPGKLFADGDFSRTLTEAFVSIELRARGLPGSENSSTKLMDDTFDTRNRLQGEKKQASDHYHEQVKNVLAGVELAINPQMEAINDESNGGEYNASELTLSTYDSYTFETPKDRGTSIYYRSTIVYNLAVVQSSKVQYRPQSRTTRSCLSRCPRPTYPTSSVSTTTTPNNRPSTPWTRPANAHLRLKPFSRPRRFSSSTTTNKHLWQKVESKGTPMKIRYNILWKILIDKNEPVRMDVLIKIASALEYEVGDLFKTQIDSRNDADAARS